MRKSKGKAIALILPITLFSSLFTTQQITYATTTNKKSSTTTTLQVNTVDDLSDAVSMANEGKDVVANITTSIHYSLKQPITLNNGSLTIKGGKIQLGNTFLIKNNAHLCLDSIEVSSTTDSQMFDVLDTATLTLTNNSKLGPSKGQFGPAAINAIDSSKIVIDNATITQCSGNTYCYGALFINDDATLIMNDGVIDSCETTDGAISLNKNASFILNGGTIKNCKALKWGGGAVILQGNSSFVMNNGLLTNNTGTMGGAVLEMTNSNTGVVINGGTINNNTATYGGAILAYTNTKNNLTISSNSCIYNNTADTADDIYYAGTGTLVLGKTCNKQLDCGDAIDGWYEDDIEWNCKDTNYAVEVVPGTYKDKVLILKAAHTHTRFNLSVLLGTPNKTSVLPGNKVQVTANAPQTGEVFDKWVIEDAPKGFVIEDNNNPTTSFVMPDSDITIKATYKPIKTNTYKITIVLNYIGSQDEILEVPSNSTADITSPKRPGYEFIGWYTDQSYNTKFDVSEAIASDITLYAKWSEIKEVVPTDPDKPGNVINNPGEPKNDTTPITTSNKKPQRIVNTGDETKKLIPILTAITAAILILFSQKNNDN